MRVVPAGVLDCKYSTGRHSQHALIRYLPTDLPTLLIVLRYTE